MSHQNPQTALSTTPGPESRAPISPAKLAANRANALKSTGPKSPDGKTSSSKNSVKHGHCALVVDVPGEDPGLFRSRFQTWNGELNPAGLDHSAYTVALLVRHSQGLDRIAVARAARSAKLARDAVKARASARAAEVEEALRLLMNDSDIAVRRLRETPEGCAALINEWEHLGAALVLPAHWDADDADRAQKLLGNVTIVRGEAPNVAMIPTKWIERHRKMEERLSENRWPDAVSFDLKYKAEGAKKRDEFQIEGLRDAARNGTVWLGAIIDAEVSGLRGLMARLEEEEAIDVEEATLRARVDTSEEGRLIHRYELEGQRGYFKTLAVLKKDLAEQKKEQAKPVVTDEPPAQDAPPAEASPARNEATATGSTYEPRPIRGVANEVISDLDSPVSPRINPSDQE